MTLLLVLIGGAVGAPARYLADRAVQSRHTSAFPWGTLLVNVVGSGILGVLTGAADALPAAAGALVGTGFCGALTTYSTFSFEAMRLVQLRAYGFALAYVSGSLTLGLAAAFAGYALGRR